MIYSQYSQYKSNLDRWKWYFPWYEDRTWKLENLYIKHKPPLKAIANVSQLIYKEKGILNFTVCLRRIWITVCYLAVFMNIQYWIWRRLSIFCRCIIQIISIFRTFTCISCFMNIFNRYMTLYVYWIYIIIYNENKIAVYILIHSKSWYGTTYFSISIRLLLIANNSRHAI